MQNNNFEYLQTKKNFLHFTLFIFCFLIFGSSSSHAQTDLNVRGAGRLFPIAIPQLCFRNLVNPSTSKGADKDTSNIHKEFPDILSRDLDLSGYFEVLSQNAYIETAGKCAEVVYSDWSVIGAEGLVRGEIELNNRQIRLKVYLHDVQRRDVVLGKQYDGDLQDLPQMAHKFANEIMKFFTGSYGIFGTQIAYSSKIGRFKELFVMDMDGSNIRQLTNDKGLAVSVSWHPSTKGLIYTSYRNRTPDLFLLDIASKRVSQVTRGSAMELGAKFTKDGGRVLISKSNGSDSDIVMINTDGTQIAALTKSGGIIDVSPSFSPDQDKITFCSNRSGGPQIYVMNSDGSDPRRISFVSSNYCTSPSWSPRGDKIAFVCRAERGFHIFVSNADGSSPLQLTSYGSNEDPSWSPDGRYLVFSTTFGKGYVYNLALIREDGSNLRQLTFSRGGDYQPSWSPRGE